MRPNTEPHGESKLCSGVGVGVVVTLSKKHDVDHSSGCWVVVVSIGPCGQLDFLQIAFICPSDLLCYTSVSECLLLINF